MKKKSKPFIIYAYRLTDDSGNAPCIHDLDGNPTGILTLACCKGGQIRNGKGVKTGLRHTIGKKYKDAIDRGQIDVYLMGIYKNTLLYFANITEIISMKDYFASDSRYKRRMDSIYDYTHAEFKRNSLNPDFHHKNGPERHKRDQLGEYVLISTHFAYWGKDSKVLPYNVLRFLPRFQESKSYEGTSHEGELIIDTVKTHWKDFKGIIQNEPHRFRKTRYCGGCAII